MQLSKAMQSFILHWGEMGTKWGVTRTVAQVHALLYLSPRPLAADEIAETLNVARSNVSQTLKELIAWRLIKTTHVIGDRRDHFEAFQDNWYILRTIVEERKRREIDPVRDMLVQCVAAVENTSDPEQQEINARIVGMLGFVNMLTGWYEQISGLPEEKLKRLITAGSRITKWLN